MTLAHWHQDPDEPMHSLLLRVIGGFAHVQDAIGELIVGLYFQTHANTDLTTFMGKWVKDKIREDERPKLLQEVAKENGSDAELQNFNGVYGELAKFRHRAAHSTSFVQRDVDTLVITKKNIGSAAGPGDPEPMVVTRTDLLDKLRRCAWLEAQVIYVATSHTSPRTELRTGTTPSRR